jgi:DNA-binding HxlR family transcriptional regulator
LEVTGGGWGALFGAISTKTLTERLPTLESGAWVTRHDEPTVPPQVTYALTETVLELDGVMTELDRPGALIRTRTVDEPSNHRLLFIARRMSVFIG